MEENHIVKFDPWLLGAIQKAMGNLPAIPGDLVKVKSLTFFDGGRFSGKEMLLLNKWIELASGDFSAIGKMPNLHTLLFKNVRILRIGNWDFLRQCRKLKKLDLSGTDFSDCELLAELPNLQYALLPDRWQLIHTEVLERIQARTETNPEMNERARAQACIDIAARDRGKVCKDTIRERVAVLQVYCESGLVTRNNAVQERAVTSSDAVQERAAASNGAAAGERVDTCHDAATQGNTENAIAGLPPQMDTGTYAADPKLICWIMVSLGKMPRTPNDLAKIKLLDSRKRNLSLCNPALDNLAEKLPPWLIEKGGDFSLIGKLPNLQALLLWGVILDDFSFLSECKELLYVNLWDTNFTDCSLLTKLPYIIHIYLPEEGQLVNFSMLVKYRQFRLQEERERRESFLYEAKSDEIPEAEQSQAIQTLGRPSVFRIECQKSFGQKADVSKRKDRQVLPEGTQKSALPIQAGVEGTSEIPFGVGVEKGSDIPLKVGVDGMPDSVQVPDAKEANVSSWKTKVEEAVWQKDEFNDLAIVRGEDVIISYEGASQVRQVRAEFWMDRVPALWRVFDQMKEEEDNWAKLAPGKAEQLTDELITAIRRGDAKTIEISLEPWGEGHNFIVEFRGRWVEITYVDDEIPVCYNSYHPDFPEMLAFEDMELVAEVVRHILATGQLLPGTFWRRE